MKTDKIERAFEHEVAAGEMAGAVALVWEKGEIVCDLAVGQISIEQRQPMKRDTIFRLASMTKPITSLAALILMEEGAFALDDPVMAIAPELSAMRVLRTPGAALKDSVPAERSISFRDLLAHRSGFAYGFTATGPLAAAYDDAFGDVRFNHLAPDQWLAKLAALPLMFQPGAQMHYGYSTDVLGILIGRLAGKRFDRFLAERIFTPLGMEDTGFALDDTQRSRLAQLYQSDGAGKLQRVDLDVPSEPPAFCAGGGGLVSTAEDYLRFCRHLLDGTSRAGRPLVSQPTLELMRSDQLTPLQHAIPFLGMPYWNGMGFGLGVSIVTDPDKHSWMGPGEAGAIGWPGAWGTWWQVDPTRDLIIIYLVQKAIPLDAAAIANLPPGRPLQPRPGLLALQKVFYG